MPVARGGSWGSRGDRVKHDRLGHRIAVNVDGPAIGLRLCLLLKEKDVAKVFRGGGWSNIEGTCHMARRNWASPGIHYQALGVRLCLQGEERDVGKVSRGGCWFYGGTSFRSADRETTWVGQDIDGVRPAIIGGADSVAMTATEFPLSAYPDHPELAIYADWLETEQGRSDEAEALRLSLALVRPTEVWPGKDPARLEMEARLRTLAEQGITAPFPVWVVGPDIMLRYIPPGAFWMGSPEDEPERQSGEILHRVTITQGFWLADFPMTQEQWAAVTGARPSHFQGENLPVESVSWNDCQAMLERLREQTGLAGWCLPSEARWEYACRAGTTSPFFWGQNLTTDQANYDGSYPYNGGPKGQNRKRTTPRGTFLPNAWGLQDMHGNVWEWCQDEYRPYTAEPVVEGEERDPFGGTSERGPSECSEAGIGQKSERTPARPNEAGTSLRRTTTSASASASASREGEQGGPFGSSGADPTGMTPRDGQGVDRGTRATVPTATRRSQASASPSAEGEQGRPFRSRPGAATTSTAAADQGRRRGTTTTQAGGTPTSASASAFSGERLTIRVHRGGGWSLVGMWCRAFNRGRNGQGCPSWNRGLRLCLLGG